MELYNILNTNLIFKLLIYAWIQIENPCVVKYCFVELHLVLGQRLFVRWDLSQGYLLACKPIRCEPYNRVGSNVHYCDLYKPIWTPVSIPVPLLICHELFELHTPISIDLLQNLWSIPE